jgi:hypothetical protein
LSILEGYGVGPNMLAILRNFWSQQNVVVRQGGYHSEAFKAERGTTQGGIPPPTIFNVSTDAVVRTWIWETSNNIQETIEVGSLETEADAGFYVDDGAISLTDNVCLQGSVNHLVELFARVGLDSNTTKTKAMVASPGPKRGHLTIHVYKRKLTGIGPSYRARQRRKVQCPTCKKDYAIGYIKWHHRDVHGS